MGSIKDYLHLIVPEYIPMAITTALIGAIITSGGLPGLEFIVVAVVLILLVSAFNAFNAIADKDIDRVNKPERPIPSKRITEREALYFAVFSYALALIISLSVNMSFFVVTLVSVLITSAYSYPGIDLKRRFLAGNFTVTIFYAILCYLSGWALYPTQAVSFPIMGFLFLTGLSLSISKDFMDVPGDAFHRAHTLPVKLGRKYSILTIILFLLVAFVFLFIMILKGFLPNKYYYLFALFPLMVLNISEFRKKSTTYESNDVFLKTIILIISLEFAIIALELF